MQIATFEPVAAAGNGLTVTVTLLVFVQPVAVIVSVTEYVVVADGVTVGLGAVETKPAGDEVQLYVLPTTPAAPIVVEPPAQTATFDPATAAGNA